MCLRLTTPIIIVLATAIATKTQSKSMGHTAISDTISLFFPAINDYSQTPATSVSTACGITATCPLLLIVTTIRSRDNHRCLLSHHRHTCRTVITWKTKRSIISDLSRCSFFLYCNKLFGQLTCGSGRGISHWHGLGIIRGSRHHSWNWTSISWIHRR
ncbi:uncharacterized protein BYT42DRAFT_70407 [Radiomyces spectabilis]|uniref:uncharacterized protein n=1 Tax=Radiomyces spectabilis TaxID=64574 RepID=UPI00221E6B5C|nr:uncharacterized protein BYT42DRAFT_70407 [Radiomyces spectabilis]KAI8371497.1 hypothetical protein BYT42DRAFT_70407 [Radiomyces spectabilis]